jgi:hypothetical protein
MDVLTGSDESDFRRRELSGPGVFHELGSFLKRYAVPFVLKLPVTQWDLVGQKERRTF